MRFWLDRTPPQTTGVAKPEPKIKTSGRVDEGLHGQICYAGPCIVVKVFFTKEASGVQERRCLSWTSPPGGMIPPGPPRRGRIMLLADFLFDTGLMFSP